ncbi:unnamed protein product [Ascophyllum nodosum]
MNNLKNSGTVATKKGAYRIRVHPFLHLTKRALLASLGAGLGSLSLMIIAVVAELLERRWFPLLIITVALVLQLVCGMTTWRIAWGKTCSTPRVASGGNDSSSRRGNGLAGGINASSRSRRNGSGGSSSSSSHTAEQGLSTLSTAEAEEAFNRRVVLETPLQQAARALEFILDHYSPDARTQEKLEMVLNIISLPEDLNMITRQSIINADLDSSTTEWIQAQLSSGSSPVQGSNRGSKWKRLRTNIRGVISRVADEAVNKQKIESSANTGMSVEELRRQNEVGRAFRMEKAVSLRSRRKSSSMNVSQLMTLPRARVRPQEMALLEEEEGSNMEAMSVEGDEENAGGKGLTELIPVWPGIALDSRRALAGFLNERHFLDWQFDVFKLQELSDGHALWYAGMLTLYHYNYVGVFNINPSNLSKFLAHVEKNYCYDPGAPNPYHTSVHAADVTLTVSHFCENPIIASGIKALQGFALVVAAIVHDYRHKGVNNNYLIKVRDNLAITYNDASVLENFHLSEAFKVLYDDHTNILGGLAADESRHFRQLLIKIILATDLAHGFEYVSRFTASTITKGGRRATIVPDMAREDDDDDSSTGAGGASAAKGSQSKDPLQAQILLMQMVIKVADVSHPMKPWELHDKWTKLITEEFHRQGDREAKEGVPISPLCSREGHNQAKSQCDFINFVVRPCATVFSEFCRDEVWLATLEKNFRRWSEMMNS